MTVIPLAAEDALIRGLPQRRAENVYIVPTPAGPTQFALRPRNGLASFYNLTADPVRGVFAKAGVYNGDVFTVTGGQLYRGATVLGLVANDNLPARFAASDTELVLTSGGFAYSYNGSMLTQNTDPDLPSVVDVAFLAGRFIYVEKDSDQFHWSAIGDSLSIDGLDFATAESSPDKTRTVETLGDDLMFCGGDTVEFWNPSTDITAPFARSSGRRYDKGILGVTSVIMDNALHWLGSDRRVYRGGAVPTGISTPELEDRIAECANPDQARAYYAGIKGEQFYVLNLPGVGTWAYQVSKGKWQKWSSFEQTLFRPACATTYQGVTYFGDSQSGQVLTFGQAFTDLAEPISYVTSAFVPIPSGSPRNKNVSLLCTKGVGTATGQGINPQVEMRYTDEVDGGYSAWAQEALGVQGDRQIKTTWWGLDAMQSPGRLYEFRCTDPVEFMPYGVTINEDRP